MVISVQKHNAIPLVMAKLLNDHGFTLVADIYDTNSTAMDKCTRVNPVSSTGIYIIFLNRPIGRLVGNRQRQSAWVLQIHHAVANSQNNGHLELYLGM